MAFIIKQLHLTNFKCFRDHIINFDQITIMIGQNNAGKTTVVEALRILGLVCARFKTVNTYSNRPNWLSDQVQLSVRGITVSAKAIDTDLEQIFTAYGNPPAIIEAFFTEDITIRIYIGSEADIFATFYKCDTCVRSKQRVTEYGVPNVCVLPQIVPLTKDEDRVTRETLQRNKFSKRISGNFRNDLYVNKDSEKFRKLQESIERTWGSVRINSVEVDSSGSKVYLSMRDTDFVSEIYYMGHGIQMWLQTLWFVVSSAPDSIIVLDEPDVYMHADLQRKLVRMLKDQYKQTIIATHSIEIMSEVLPENILIIDRKNPESILADDYPVLQTAISNMGSIHNINLARLLNHRRYLYVEGKDIGILKIFYDKLFPNQPEPLDHFPSMPTGGWGSWDMQKKNVQALIQQMPDLKPYFIYDHDYHRGSVIQKRKKEAKDCGVRLHIWNKKELENYLLVPSSIARFIKKKRPNIDKDIVQNEINEMLRNICDGLKENVVDNISDEEFHGEKGVEPSTVRKKVQKELDSQWDDLSAALNYVPGKEVVSMLSARCQQRYKVSFSPQQIASCMLKNEIDKEIEQFLVLIRDGR